MSKDSQLEDRRHEISREIAKLSRETQENIAADNLAFQAYRLEKEQELQREQ